MKNNKIHLWRRTIQITIALYFIFVPIMNDSGFKFIWGNFLNIHIGKLVFSDPLAVLQVIINNRYIPVGLLIGAGLILTIAFFLGTIFCSWVCPFGLLSELTNKISRRFRSQKKINTTLKEKTASIKIGFFLAGLIISIMIFRTPILNHISMPFQYSNIFQYLFIQKHLSGAIWFIGIVLLVEFISCKRLWCRWVCPQSILITIVGQLNPFRLKIIYQKKNCLSNISSLTPPCQKACSLDIDPRNLSLLNQTQCTNCGDCIDDCNNKGKALGFGFKQPHKG